jgi:hypothetical protein
MLVSKLCVIMASRHSGAEEEGEGTSDPCYCERLEDALLQAAMVFGESVVEALVTSLKVQYGIRLGPSRLPCSSLEEIEKALTVIAGSGAQILMERMREILEK